MTASEQPAIARDQGTSVQRPTQRTVAESGSYVEPQPPYLQIENVHKEFGAFIALRDVYLNVYPGEFICLLGPSGCGKTTLLRIVAGLEQQTQGRVIQGGQDVSHLPPSKRDFGIVFQSYALFPNLTAAQNVAYGLQNTKQPKEKINARVAELLEMVGLGGFSNKYPPQMSGGQQQRVALARALALSPGLLLLDEPLSALDAKVRVRLRTEIAQLQKRLGITTVMVTHDQAEALAMANRVVVMDRGIIAQVGAPHVIYQYPNTPFVANFIGVMNFLKGVVISDKQVRCGNIVLDTPNNALPVNNQAVVAVRPEDVRVVPASQLHDPSAANTMAAEVQELEFLGSGYRVSLLADGDSKEPVVVEISSHEARELNLSPHARLTMQFPPELIRVFPEE